MREMVGGCCVCSDDRGWSENPLVYCDGQSCTVAVHQACYGIVTVPTGPWYCRKCESQERSVKVKCELCPSKYGALKRTDNSGWAHVVCALYIPEVRFGNVTTMEPIQLQLIPAERFNKLCYICEEKGKAASATVGACMQCNKSGCRQQFHVTCAQALGLLCEEAGNYLDNVKYCGYCQHHYSKLKKWGNVKTIPPYKPVSSENQQSDSDKDTESANNTTVKSSSTSPATSKRKSSSGVTKSSSSLTKSATGRVSTNNPTPSGPNTVHSGNKGANKLTTNSATATTSNNNKSAKVEEVTTNSSVSVVSTNSESLVLKEPKVEDSEQSVKSETKSAKKRKSNSRTPTPVSVNDSLSVVISSSSEKKTIAEEKPKKMRIETTQSILTNQPVVALTSISAIKVPSPLNSTATDTPTPPSTTTVVTMSSSEQQVTTSTQMQPINSLVVSLPLTSTSSINNNAITQERSGTDERNAISSIGTKSCILPTEKSSDGLKITFEVQEGAINIPEMDMERVEEPSKRSNEKTEKPARGKKRNTASNGQLGNSKRGIRTQHTPPPQLPIVGVFSSVTQSQLKDSPPSSPSSESQGASLPLPSRGRTKGRKSAPASIMGGSSSTSKDIKDIKLFQNGITAPHMLGNQLNPNSNMAQKMSDHLNSELEAHSIFNANENSSNMVGPQLHHRIVQSARASSVGGSSTASGGSGISSMISGTGGGNIPQTLDQLLERQWEQGSQFLMEQAQHFDIASLLSCLHQLRAENLRLEEDLTSLLQRRDHLLAVNARLAIPLTGQPNAVQSNHSHTVNNIHPAVGMQHGELARPPRSNIGFGNHPQGSMEPVENGLSSEQGYSHRSQPSPTVRHSSANLPYNNSGVLRPSADASGRSAPRPQQFPMYQNPGPSQSQPQVVLRRDADIHHQSGTKPS